MIELEPILTACLTGMLYSVLWWGTKTIDPTKPSPAFEWTSLVATAIIGAGVGIAAVLTGSPLTQMSIETQLIAYGTVIAVIERVVKTMYHYIENKFEGEQHVE
jgi:amino acid transporter